MNEVISAHFVKRFMAGATVQVTNLRTREDSGIAVLFGPSGAGKTTALRCLAGLEKIDEGNISFRGQVWSDVSGRCFIPPRDRRIGFVPQEFRLFPHLSVERNIGYGVSRISPAERRSRVQEMITWLGLDGLEQRLPDELSGGQQQRVALARAVAGRPGLLLLDEPLAALDAPTRLRLRSDLRHKLKEAGIPAVLVTHDRNEALAIGDEMVVMNDGQILQQGPVQEIFSRPATSEVAAIVGVETVQPGQVLEFGAELVAVSVGSSRLFALKSDLATGTREVFVCIRAEDVILIKGEPSHSSPRNCLPSTVRAISSDGPMVRIGLDCGFPLVAMLTKQACAEMGLTEGMSVVAMVKAPNVHLIGR
jgi:molybdate transport system ATP-binding protein